mmetsp:Transcript_30613/g.71776  ORF Transcript_30613/g.71776 Transcript_30613/m.71776 type:complete len:241 (-) Transcript_30613:1270-1992(-)
MVPQQLRRRSQEWLLLQRIHRRCRRYHHHHHHRPHPRCISFALPLIDSKSHWAHHPLMHYQWPVVFINKHGCIVRQSRTRQSVTRHQKNLTYIKEGNRNGAEQQSILMVPSHLQQSGQQQLTLENVLLIKNVFRHILVCGKGIRIAEAHRGGRGILSTLDRARGIQQTQHIAFAHHLAQGFRPRVQGTINFGTGMVRCGAAKALQKGFIQYLGGGKGQGCAVVWKFATRIDEPVDNIVIR